MLELLKTQRLLNLKKQRDIAKQEAVKTMESGDLKAYFEKITMADKLKKEISETLSIKV